MSSLKVRAVSSAPEPRLGTWTHMPLHWLTMWLELTSYLCDLLCPSLDNIFMTCTLHKDAVGVVSMLRFSYIRIKIRVNYFNNCKQYNECYCFICCKRKKGNIVNKHKAPFLREDLKYLRPKVSISYIHYLLLCYILVKIDTAGAGVEIESEASRVGKCWVEFKKPWPPDFWFLPSAVLFV